MIWLHWGVCIILVRLGEVKVLMLYFCIVVRSLKRILLMIALPVSPNFSQTRHYSHYWNHITFRDSSLSSYRAYTGPFSSHSQSWSFVQPGPPNQSHPHPKQQLSPSVSLSKSTLLCTPSPRFHFSQTFCCLRRNIQTSKRRLGGLSLLLPLESGIRLGPNIVPSTTGCVRGILSSRIKSIAQTDHIRMCFSPLPVSHCCTIQCSSSNLLGPHTVCVSVLCVAEFFAPFKLDLIEYHCSIEGIFLALSRT